MSLAEIMPFNLQQALNEDRQRFPEINYYYWGCLIPVSTNNREVTHHNAQGNRRTNMLLPGLTEANSPTAQICASTCESKTHIHALPGGLFFCSDHKLIYFRLWPNRLNDLWTSPKPAPLSSALETTALALSHCAVLSAICNTRHPHKQKKNKT